MSANNAVVIQPILWTHPKVYTNGVVSEWATTKKWLVFHGDVDQHGELTHKGQLTREFLWYAMLEKVEVFDDSKVAGTAAVMLGSQINPLEYGIIVGEPLLYEEPL
jgi:hypothetical protein